MGGHHLINMDWLVILGVGLLIMAARILDVSIGTLRVISVIDGRLKTSFLLGFVEVAIWLSVVSITLDKIAERPVLALFFALGFSLGNVLGILVERRVPLGNLSLRVVGGPDIRDIASEIRDLGLGATVVPGEGRSGERLLLFCFMPKKMLPKVMKILKPRRDHVFYSLDYGGSSNKILLPVTSQPAGPRRFFKRK